MNDMNAPTTSTMFEGDLPEIFRLTETEQHELLENFYPGATVATKKLIINYCRGMRIDPMLKPVHVVPMKVKTGKMIPKRGGGEYPETVQRDVIMPGIGLYRIQAARTGTYAGKDRPAFGPMLTWEFERTEWEDNKKQKVKDQVIYPEWCEVTVYKMVAGTRCPYTATEYWMENVAVSYDAPNAMWSKRTHGQLAKCAEAQALRMAYPEVGSMPTYEEMMGRKFLDPEDVDRETDNGERATTSQEPQRKSAQIEQRTIEGVATRVRDLGDPAYTPPDPPPAHGTPVTQPPPPPQKAAESTTAEKASAGEVAHIKSKFGARLDEACEAAGLTTRTDTINNLSKDGFIALLDIKREWKL